MRFSSMAVSVLAQSLPLLAVGHLDGWKKREERSRLQRRRLRDAGMLFEKRVEVRDKRGNVLKKRHAGSARLLQDSTSNEAPSVDRETSVECDPRAKVTDSGIFGCGMDSHCVESENSELGGLCVASKKASSISRALEDEGPAQCYAAPADSEYTCDCSQFDNTTGFGIFTCTNAYGDQVNNYTYNDDGSYILENCSLYDESSDTPFSEYCISLIYQNEAYSCAVKIDDTTCTSCAWEDVTCFETAEPGDECCRIRDCTNTIAMYNGNSCEDDETQEPTDAGNAPPSETSSGGKTSAPAPTSSGSSHATKMTVVVSAAAAAWMASIGT